MPVDLEKLTAPFPQSAIKQRQGGGGRMLDYIEGHVVIRRLNEATGNCWDMVVKSITTQAAGNDRQGNPQLLMIAHVALTLPDLGTREGLGVQMVNERGGEDLVKGCITDGLKKAATLFGVGLELYGPDYEAGEIAAPRARQAPHTAPVSPPQPVQVNVKPGGAPRASEAQIRNLYRLARKAGQTEADFKREIYEAYEAESASDLSRQEASALIESLMKAVGEEPRPPTQNTAGNEPPPWEGAPPPEPPF